ncbi:hypothetical protein NDK47_23965 [Brevibacillus ruminantium]|uniref:Uncharacterized protein n=1 Tax=Brevibacillus ruminantium TaxID=2950604 RepID=A0ABY4WD96_9BACL|nr:hypothetical protein [Brevibacillus ruminantium]USG65142.1 hypothetical protein NDK47_23965 [Brevibacillus ruminantium]
MDMLLKSIEEQKIKTDANGKSLEQKYETFLTDYSRYQKSIQESPQQNPHEKSTQKQYYKF